MQIITNPLLLTDVYKMGHMEQYAPGTEKVYSYLCARNNKYYQKHVFFGLQYYLQQYLSQPLEDWMGEEFIHYRTKILGSTSPNVEKKIRDLCRLGYWPLHIKALAEGTVIGSNNCLMTIENTNRDFYWCVGFVESMLLKLWYPCSVASCSLAYREVVDKYFKETVDNKDFLKPYMVHDFGYRGDSSEEGAAISGAAHLLSFVGSDTVPAYPFIDEFYNVHPSVRAFNQPIMASVPASEHSVMCSFGKENEMQAIENMLNLYPEGIVSIVSDTYDIYNVCSKIIPQLKDKILARNGKVVIRPDSGDPKKVLCGDPEGTTPEARKGVFLLLEEVFGSTVNNKGYKELHPNIGVIYGDGMYLERYKDILETMKQMKFAASNLVIGVGGILRNHSRDTLGFAIKATYVENAEGGREIFKDPITDTKKKSHRGKMIVVRDTDGSYKTIDRVGECYGCKDLLKDAFIDGQTLLMTIFAEIRQNLESHLNYGK